MSDMVLHEGGLEFRSTDGEPRIRDLDLAERLGYERPRTIRDLIRDAEKNVNGFGICRATRQNHDGGRGRPAGEYWLTERQALFITTRSGTAKAAELTMLLVDAFIAVRRQLEVDENALRNFPRRLVETFLLPQLRPRQLSDDDVFQPSFVAAISSVYGIPWGGGVHPRFQAMTNRMIYDRVCSSTVAAEIKTRNPLPKWGNNHWQFFTAEALTWFRAELKIVEAIAHQADNRRDFWLRMDRHYAAGMLQLGLGAR